MQELVKRAMGVADCALSVVMPAAMRRLGQVIKPGWYVDYENPKQMRYHDGAVWTDYVHADRQNLPGAPFASAVQDVVVGDTAVKQDAPWVKLAGFVMLGLFVGLVLGLFMFNGVGAITPTTEAAGTVERIDIEITSSTNATNRRTYVLLGTTSAGESWKIVDEDAYNTLQSEGYPQPVTLAIGDWTGTPERVTGNTFVVDHQSTGPRRLGLSDRFHWCGKFGLGLLHRPVKMRGFACGACIPGLCAGSQKLAWLPSSAMDPIPLTRRKLGTGYVE